jgi:hypothetical protein
MPTKYIIFWSALILLVGNSHCQTSPGLTSAQVNTQVAAVLKHEQVPLRNVPCTLEARPQYKSIKFKHHSWVLDEVHAAWNGVELYRVSFVIGIVPAVRDPTQKVCTFLHYLFTHPGNYFA